jgi:hypothetical protein
MSSPTSIEYASGLLAAVIDGVNVHVLSAAPPAPVCAPFSWLNGMTRSS